MRLLNRYLLGQLVAPFLFAISALTAIMLLNQVARRFGALVGKGLPWSVIGEVFGLSVPFIVAMTLPMAILLAVLYSFSHLAADNEITAMRASGISVAQMLVPVFRAGLVMAAINFAFTDQVLPRSNARLRNLLFDIQRKKPTFELREQIINEMPSSGLFLRASRIDAASGRLRGVTIYDMAGQDLRRVIYADSGRMAFASNQTDLNLLLHHGYIHEFRGSEPQTFQITQFVINNIRVKDVSNQLERGIAETIRGDREMSTCEMLGVVRSASREAEQERRNRGEALNRDLRALLGLPHLTPPPAVGERPVGGYCRWFRKAAELLSPKTAQAQGPTQRPPKHPSPMARPEIQELMRHADSLKRPPVRPVFLSSWAEASATLEREKASHRRANQFAVEVHKKWAISTACLVFVLAGIPMALRFPRGGMGLVIGGGLAVFSIYYVGLIAGEGLADRGLASPVLAMWAPNLVLSVLGIAGLWGVSRESGSTRGGDLADLFNTLFGRFRRRKR